MTLENAKKIKCDFVNMSQYYNGYEITDMWNMMCEQLFNELSNKSCKNCKHITIKYDMGLCSIGVCSDFKIGTFYCSEWKLIDETNSNYSS